MAQLAARVLLVALSLALIAPPVAAHAARLGQTAIAWSDADEDGKPEAYGVDWDDDGEVDEWWFDDNEDGTIDQLSR